MHACMHAVCNYPNGEIMKDEVHDYAAGPACQGSASHLSVSVRTDRQIEIKIETHVKLARAYSSGTFHKIIICFQAVKENIRRAIQPHKNTLNFNVIIELPVQGIPI